MAAQEIHENPGGLDSGALTLRIAPPARTSLGDAMLRVRSHSAVGQSAPESRPPGFACISCVATTGLTRFLGQNLGAGHSILPVGPRDGVPSSNSCFAASREVPRFHQSKNWGAGPRLEVRRAASRSQDQVLAQKLNFPVVATKEIHANLKNPRKSTPETGFPGRGYTGNTRKPRKSRKVSDSRCFA